MNFQNNQKKLVVFILAGALALPSFCDDTPPKSADKAAAMPSEAQMMTMMMDLAKPGDNHKLLETNLVGSWSYTVKMWMSPDAPPTESTGKTTTKAVMGGRYFQSDHSSKIPMAGPDGKPMMMEFNGTEVVGFDNVKKMFVSSWVDNMGTGIMMSTGAYDPATRTLTYTSEAEQMPGMKTKVRETLKFTDKDHHTFEFFEEHEGKEIKTMQIVSTRKG